MSVTGKRARTKITAKEFHSDKNGKRGVAYAIVFDADGHPLLREVSYDGAVVTGISETEPMYKPLVLARAIERLERQAGL